MKKQTKVLLAGIGAAVVGGAIGYYANSDKGRKQRNQAANAIKETSAKAATTASEYATSAKTAISDLTSKAANYVHQATDKAKHALAGAHETMENKANTVKNKAQKAFSNGETVS